VSSFPGKISDSHSHDRFVQLAIRFSLILAVPFFFFGGPSPTSTPLLPAVWNLGHILFFVLFTIWLRQDFALLRDDPGLLKFIIYSLAVLIVGLAIEWAQYGFDRNPDWHDVWRDLLGAGLAWSFLSRRCGVSKVLLGLLIVFLAAELFLVVGVAWTDRKIQNQLPVISELETEADVKHWTGAVSLSHVVAARGTASLKIQFSTTLYSGTGLKNLPRDWRGYQWLAFEIFNPGADQLRLTIRINDKIHDQQGYRYDDRFNKRLFVDPGWNHFEIPLDDIQSAPKERKMDLKNVIGLGLFTTELDQPRVLFFDYFRLK
jgi:hypothetical protein